MKYGEYNAVDIIRHFVVPKANNFVAERVQVFCSLLIVFLLFQMLRAIQFDDEFFFDADEIRDVVTNGVLSAGVDFFRS